MNALSISRSKVEEYINEISIADGQVSGANILELEVKDKYLEIKFSYCGIYKKEKSGSYDLPDNYIMDIDYKGKTLVYDENGDLESIRNFHGTLN